MLTGLKRRKLLGTKGYRGWDRAAEIDLGIDDLPLRKVPKQDDLISSSNQPTSLGVHSRQVAFLKGGRPRQSVNAHQHVA